MNVVIEKSPMVLWASGFEEFLNSDSYMFGFVKPFLLLGKNKIPCTFLEMNNVNDF